MNHIHKRNKKTVIQIVGNPLYQQQKSKNSTVTNPLTNTPIFGNFPQITQYGFEAGDIVLKYGEHKSLHKGFGFMHIWYGHFKSITDPVLAEQTVCDFINSIINSGSIFYEGNGNRNIIFQGGAGTIILEKRLDGQNQTIYVVITAIPNGQSNGFKIGDMP